MQEICGNLNSPTTHPLIPFNDMLCCCEKSSNLFKNYTGFLVRMAKMFGQESKNLKEDFPNLLEIKYRISSYKALP